MTLPKHIRLAGIEKIAAGLGGASYGMPGLTHNETANMPDIVSMKPFGKGTKSVTGVPNPSMNQQQNLVQANMPKVPDQAQSHFMPKIAEIPVGNIVGDVASEVLDQLWLRRQLKNKGAGNTGFLKKRMRGEEPSVQSGGFKLGAMAAAISADNGDGVPYAPYQAQNSFRAAGGGQTVTGPGNNVSDLVNSNFGAVAKRLDTWQSDEPSNASSATGQEGSAYNEPIKSAATVRRSGESVQDIAGDNHPVEHGIRSQKATYDMTETRGGIGDSPYEGIPRMHDSMVGGRQVDVSDGVDKSFNSLKVPIDTSVMENSNNIDCAASPQV
jgi:hypothetical protein